MMFVCDSWKCHSDPDSYRDGNLPAATKPERRQAVSALAQATQDSCSVSCPGMAVAEALADFSFVRMTSLFYVSS